MTDSAVFCDYLSITYSAIDHPVSAVSRFLLDVGAEVRRDDLYSLGAGGTVTLGLKYGSMRISASGAALTAMRQAGVFMDFLSLLSECPHNVTLLDLTLDVWDDAPRRLRALQRRYKGSRVNLTRKGMEWTVLMSERPSDGAMTGTFYVGRKTSARVGAKVYDKQEEARVRRGSMMPPCTRYEVSVRKDYGATLRDAAEPTRLFWHLASPALLPRPEEAPQWSSGWSQGWKAGPRPEYLPADLLSRRIGDSPELRMLLSIADEMGPEGRVWLVRQFSNAAGVDINGTLSRRSEALVEPAEA